MDYTSTVFFKIDDFNSDYEIVTIAELEDIDTTIKDIIPELFLEKPSNEIMVSLFAKLNEFDFY